MSQQHSNQGDAPLPGRPQIPASFGLGGGETDYDMTPWSHVEEQMTISRNYWVATARPDGRPHCMPVWGVWLNGTFYFGTDRASRKAKNLALNPLVVVHLESGDDAIILEGRLDQVGDPDLLKRIDEAYFTKYDIHVLDNSEVGIFYPHPQHRLGVAGERLRELRDSLAIRGRGLA